MTKRNRNSRAPWTPNYPQTRRVDQVDVYHGTSVADPYRWLEDDRSAETGTWVDAQNAVTESFLGTIPERKLVADRLTNLLNYEKLGSPSKHGKRTFFWKNSGLQNHSVLYVVDAEGAEPRVLIDPNTLSADGTVSLGSTSINEDGTLIAYCVSLSGSDWVEIRVRDIGTGNDLPDVIKWVKFSGASWTQDGRGFYYGRFDAPKPGDELKGSNFFQKLYFHTLGQSQEQDVLIMKDDEHKEWSFSGGETEDGRYLLLYVSSGTARKYKFWYKDLKSGSGEFVKLVDDFSSAWSYVTNVGTMFWFITDVDAPRKRVVKVDLAACTPGQPLPSVDIIPQAAEPLQGLGFVGNRFFAHYSKDVCTEIRQYDTEGKFLGNVKLPGLGSAGGFGGDREDTTTYYTFSSYTQPATTYKYDIATGESTVYFRPKIDMDPSKYTTKRVFYTSKDGTKVPMFISYRKGLKRNGANPCYLYGYGGFNISGGPSFSANTIVWMDMGGIFVEACIRGGGEYGEDWHQAGTKLQKQNVFDDFIGAAEWLIANKYTSSKKLAIAGGSNGGLLVGACMTQRPELFGAALPAVGVLDMLRFHLFTIGHAWISDYGSSDDAEQFKALLAYSPLHNLKPGVAYPPTMVLTGDHDDRVVPAHSFKFAAQLQACHAGSAPVLIRISKNTGHGAGKPLAKTIEEIADKWGFLIRTFEIPARKLQRLKK